MKKITKRFFLAGILGIAFGFLCSYFVSQGTGNVSADPNFWGSPLMYSIIFNRFLIGIVIGIAGAYTECPFIPGRLRPWVRGAFWGAVISLDIAIGIFIGPVNPEIMKTIFWMTIGAGAVYGLIIDLIVTKLVGEGKELLK